MKMLYSKCVRMAAFAAACLVSTAVHAQSPNSNGAGRRCTNESLEGAFSFTAQGFTVPGIPLPPPLQGPFASGGRATFDGKGNFTLAAAASFNGAVQPPIAVTGTYSVNPDCTYTSQASNGVTFRSVIVDGGNEILILQTSPGSVVTGIAKKQSPRVNPDGRSGRALRCAEDLTSGVYGFLATGFAGPPTLPLPAAAPLAGVGTVAFSADGKFLLNAQRSVNGQLDPQVLPLTGAYTLNPQECTFRMQFDVGFTFNGTVSAAGREVQFVETDPGTVLIVNAKRI